MGFGLSKTHFKRLLYTVQKKKIVFTVKVGESLKIIVEVFSRKVSCVCEEIDCVEGRERENVCVCV